MPKVRMNFRLSELTIDEIDDIRLRWYEKSGYYLSMTEVVEKAIHILHAHEVNGIDLTPLYALHPKPFTEQ